MSLIYPAGDEQVTPNIGLATWGMDEVLAENMILIDAAIGGPTDSIKINGSVVPATNFINSASVTFSVVGSNVSATATSAGSAAWASLTGDLTETQVIPWDGPTPGTPDTGISRIGVASLAIGNGIAGDFSGSLKVTTINLGSNCLLQEIPAGVTAGGLYLTSTAKYTTNPSGNPNVWIPLWTNAGATAGVANDSYLVLQAGNLAAHARCYIDFVDYDGSNKWLIGKNGQAGTTPNQYITYDVAADIHRIVMQSAADGSGGNTFIASAGAGAVIINGNDGISDNSCSGGFQVFSGGTAGSGARAVFTVSSTAINAIGIPFQADIEGYGFIGSSQFNIHLSASNSTIIATAGGSSPSHDILGINSTNGMAVNGNVFIGFTPTSDVTANVDTAISRGAANVLFLGDHGGTPNGTLRLANLQFSSDSNISRLGAASLAIGNGTAGDHTASLSMGGSLTLGATGSGTSITTFGSSSGTFNITFPGNGSQLTWGGTTISSVGGVYAGTTNTSITASGGVVTLNGNQAATANTVNVRVVGVAALTAITGVAQYSFEDACTFAPTSGSAAFASIIANPTINQTGGANGTIRVLAAYPVNTALVGTEYLLALGTSSASGPAGTLTDKFTVDNSGNLILNRINKAGADFAGQATVTAGNTTQAVTFAANYTGTGQPVIVLTPTSDPLALGVPVGYWVTYSGGAGAWTGWVLNIQTALAGNITFNYCVIGVA